MKSFLEWVQQEAMEFDAWKDKRPLAAKLAIVRKDPRFAQIPDDQIEHMLNFHTPEELLQHGPEEAQSRSNDFQIAMDAGLGWDEPDIFGHEENDFF